MEDMHSGHLTCILVGFHLQLENREVWSIAVVGAAFVHQLVRHLIVVDDDDLPAQDLEVEDVPCKPVLNDAATMLSTV